MMHKCVLHARKYSNAQTYSEVKSYKYIRFTCYDVRGFISITISDNEICMLNAF